MESTRIRKYALVGSAFVSVAVLVVVLLGGGTLAVFGGLLGLLGLGSGTTERMLNAYPLGFWGAVMAFVVGTALSFAAMKWPIACSVAMLLLAVVAFLFGGPISKFFGVWIFCTGGVVLASSLRQTKN